jgi:hypothetical protein
MELLDKKNTFKYHDKQLLILQQVQYKFLFLKTFNLENNRKKETREKGRSLIIF